VGDPRFLTEGRILLEEPGLLIAPAGLLAQADQPIGNGLVYPKARQSSTSQSGLLSSAVRVRYVGAFAQGVLSSAVQACYHQHVLCCTALGVLEHPSLKDDAQHRPCPCSSSHQVQAVTAVVCPYPLFDTKQASWSAVIRICCLRVTWCHGCSGAAQMMALWWRRNCLYGGGAADPVYPKRSGAVRGRRSAGRIRPRLDVAGVFWQWLLRGSRGPAHHRVRPGCTCTDLTLTASELRQPCAYASPLIQVRSEILAHSPVQSHVSEPNS